MPPMLPLTIQSTVNKASQHLLLMSQNESHSPYEPFKIDLPPTFLLVSPHCSVSFLSVGTFLCSIHHCSQGNKTLVNNCYGLFSFVPSLPTALPFLHMLMAGLYFSPLLLLSLTSPRGKKNCYGTGMYFIGRVLA